MKPPGGMMPPGGPGMPGSESQGEIIVPMLSSGSGSLVSRKHRLVMTNVHVAGAADSIVLYFPEYDKDGTPIVTEGYYKKKRGIKGKVVEREDRADLVLVQLESLPPNIPVLAFAPDSALPGQSVHSIGSPGVSDALFNYSPGVVRGNPFKYQWKAKVQGGDKIFEMDAWIIETNSATNPGDSGGPLVDDEGRLIGVTQGFTTKGDNVSFFIDIRECKALMEKYFAKIGQPWVPETPELLKQERIRVAELQKRLDSKTDVATRVQAIKELGKVGADANIAFAKLFKLLKDPDASVRSAAGEALKNIPPHKADVTLLCDTARDTDESIELRVQALRSLAAIGDMASAAVNLLVEQLKDADPALKKELFVALLTVGPDPKHEPLLREAWQRADAEVRRLVGENLIKLGPKAKPALRVLRAALKSPDKTTRLIAVRVIDAIGPEAQDAAPDLIVALKDSDPAIGMVAVQALIKLREFKEVVPFLVDSLKGDNSELRKQACDALGSLGNQVKTKAPVDELTIALDDPQVRPDASAALVKIGKYAADNVAVRIQKRLVLKIDSRRECIRILGQINHSSPTVVRTLQMLIQVPNGDPDEENRRIAQQVLLNFKR